MDDWVAELTATYNEIVLEKEYMARDKIPLEFEGAIPMTAALAGYDCRICMVIQRDAQDETEYIMRTKKDERLRDGHMIDYCDILEGEMCICLPDHAYAHADHNHTERVLYAERLEAILPKDDFERLDVAAWSQRKEVI